MSQYQHTSGPMTNQEAFDKVCEHLAQQKTRSFYNSGCMYRSPNGMKCAIGALIPDELYHSSIEGLLVYELYPRYTNLKFLFLKCSSSLLSDLQNSHDGKHTLKELKKELLTIATDHNLDPSKIELIVEWNP